MRIVNLNRIKAALQRPLDRIVEAFLEALDILQTHLFRLRMFLVPWDRRRRIHIIRPSVQLFARYGTAAQPRSDSGSLAAGVTELNHEVLALRVRKLDDLAEILHLRVLPEPVVFWRDPPLRCHGRRLYASNTRSALDDASHMGNVPHCVMPIFGGVLTERGEHNAVLQGQAAELKGLEELWHALLAFEDQCSACWWFLGGCEVSCGSQSALVADIY